MVKTLAVLFVLSVLGNVVALLHIDGMHAQANRLSTDLALARKDADASATAAKACSDSVKAMKDAADAQAKAGEGKRTEAKAKADTHYQRADKVLARPAPVVGDACASAQIIAGDWLRERRP